MQEKNRNTKTYNQHKFDANCEYVFLLRRVTQSQRVVQINVDFTPVCSTQFLELHHDSQYFSVLPTFNKDNKYYTPSFILQEDKLKIQEKNYELEENHNRKMGQAIEQKDQLLVAKPSKSNRFCLICKQSYDDYLTHISYPSHNRLLKSSQFYNDVIQLCEKRNPQNNSKLNKKIKKERKKTQTTKMVQKVRKNSNQKSTQALSTGLQSPQEVQLYVTVK